MTTPDYQYLYDFISPVEEPPQRVVSLVPSLTETLFDIGMGARLVGRTDYCTRPAAAQHVPAVGGTKNPDVALILSLQPDLVLANAEENRREDVEALRAAGVVVWVTFPRTVREAMNLIWDVTNAFQVEDRMVYERLNLIERQIDYVGAAALAREDGPPCRVFVPIWHEPLMTFNADTYAHDLLRVCGFTSVFAERERQYPLAADLGQAAPYAPDDPRVAGRDTRYPRVSLEEVTAAQPHVILLPDEPFAFDETHVPLFAELDVPAARDGRIHLVDGSLLTWHGTRLAHALATLPGWLCAEGT